MGLVRPSGYEVWGVGELHRTMEVDQAVIDEIVLQSGSFGHRRSRLPEQVPDFPLIIFCELFGGLLKNT